MTKMINRGKDIPDLYIDDQGSKQPTFDSVSHLTSIRVFLYLYCAATSPVESPPFFTAVDVSAYTIERIGRRTVGTKSQLLTREFKSR